MGFQWVNGDLDKLATHLRGIPEKVADAAEQLVTEGINIGADTQRDIIISMGRIDKGHMLGTVYAQGATRNGNTIEGVFGWPTNPAQGYEDYFVYQEQGFTHYLSGKDIAPMHALLQGFVKAREHVRQGLRRLLK